jgi:hypothetical protein
MVRETVAMDTWARAATPRMSNFCADAGLGKRFIRDAVLKWMKLDYRRLKCASQSR